MWRKGTLRHRCWNWNLLWPLWRIIWHAPPLPKTENKTFMRSSNSPSAYFPEENKNTLEMIYGKVICLLFNMLSRLVITSLPRRKRRLVSWLQSPPAVILEIPKIKSDTVFHCFPIYLPRSEGTRWLSHCIINIKPYMGTDGYYIFLDGHFIMYALCVPSHSVVSDSSDPMDCSQPASSVHGDSPGKNTGVGCCALLQEIFPTQESNPGLPHCRQTLYHLSHQGI